MFLAGWLHRDISDLRPTLVSCQKQPAKFFPKTKLKAFLLMVIMQSNGKRPGEEYLTDQCVFAMLYVMYDVAYRTTGNYAVHVSPSTRTLYGISPED